MQSLKGNGTNLKIICAYLYLFMYLALDEYDDCFAFKTTFAQHTCHISAISDSRVYHVARESCASDGLFVAILYLALDVHTPRR